VANDRGDVEVELARDLQAELGEGPVWDPGGGVLYSVDILRGRVHAFIPATGTLRTYCLAQSVGAVALTERGTDLILAMRDGFARLDLNTESLCVVAEVEADRPHLRMNDGKCDPAGRFWAGTLALDVTPYAGSLYRLDCDGRVHTALQPVTISNGLDWSADGHHMYFVDSPTQTIDMFDYDVATGGLANRRPFVRIAPEIGIPDGLTLDADGRVWVALWGGGAVHCYAPDGRLDGVIRLPVTHPTSCAFGGANLEDLYITTAWRALSPDERRRQPEAGAMFRCRPGAKGRAAQRFRG
jgi:sugar lactone lactonase YvrE